MARCLRFGRRLAELPELNDAGHNVTPAASTAAAATFVIWFMMSPSLSSNRPPFGRPAGR